MHIKSWYHTNQFIFRTQCKSYMQQPARICLSQGMVTRFSLTVLQIGQHQQRKVKEDLLRFCWTYVVPIVALASIALVPAALFSDDAAS